MREGAESGVLELSSHERHRITTLTNVYATLYNFCTRRAVTILTTNTSTFQTSFLEGLLGEHAGDLSCLEHASEPSLRVPLTDPQRWRHRPADSP